MNTHELNCDLFLFPQVFHHRHPLNNNSRLSELFVCIFCIGADRKAALTELQGHPSTGQ